MITPEQELANLRSLVKDSCEDEETIKRLCKAAVPSLDIEGDSYGVPMAVDIVRQTIAALTKTALCFLLLSGCSTSRPLALRTPLPESVPDSVVRAHDFAVITLVPSIRLDWNHKWEGHFLNHIVWEVDPQTAQMAPIAFVQFPCDQTWTNFCIDIPRTNAQGFYRVSAQWR